MAIVTVGAVLDRVRDFEAQLTEYYAEIRDCSTDNGVRLLTYYLARHGRRREAQLALLDPALLDSLRELELNADQPLVVAGELRVPDVAPAAVKGDDLLASASQYDRELIVFYRAILEQSEDRDVQAALEVLIRQEEGDIAMLNKMLAMRYF